MKKNPLEGLIIRTAVVRSPELGFIFACDPAKEQKEIPHTIVFTWQDGDFERNEYEYDAHTACIIKDPEPAIVDLSEPGYYTIETRSGSITEDILENSGPPPKKVRRGGFSAISEIGGKAYAVGIRGMVYVLNELQRWTRIDNGLPENFNIQAIHGFGPSELYAVGRHGQLWQYNGKSWKEHELPTNRNLTSVCGSGDGDVYVGGHGGIIIRGRGQSWEIVEHEGMEDDIWDLEWFGGKVYVSTMEQVYHLQAGQLTPVNFGNDVPESCYQMSSAKGVMWSNGEYDIMAFNGKRWSRIV
jgi:hypothetical protein